MLARAEMTPLDAGGGVVALVTDGDGAGDVGGCGPDQALACGIVGGSGRSCCLRTGGYGGGACSDRDLHRGCDGCGPTVGRCRT
ncbi:hypothetical protein ACLOJK_039251 [Asimina triloba]